ncbi:MAG: hypothetical protein L6V95_00650 [Candidatus Melainabacteria bacterium]|nr:MAG: hypothetical protein L6V95_00650 [Candidatus Melainabacteria bacterium]
MMENLKLRKVDIIIILSIILILFIGMLIGLKLNKFSKSPVKGDVKNRIAGVYKKYCFNTGKKSNC